MSPATNHKVLLAARPVDIHRLELIATSDADHAVLAALALLWWRATLRIRAHEPVIRRMSVRSPWDRRSNGHPQVAVCTFFFAAVS